MSKASSIPDSKLADKRRTNVRHIPPAWWIILAGLILLLIIYGWQLLTPGVDNVSISADGRPQLSHHGGYYEEDIRLQLHVPKEEGAGAQIIYTLDGSTPEYAGEKLNGFVYSQPIFLHASEPAVTVLRTRLVAADGTAGPLVSASYFMGLPEDMAMLSLVTDPDNLWDTELGIYLHPEERGFEWERPADITYVDPAAELTFDAPAGLRIHGQFSRSYNKKSFRLYFREEYGLNRLEVPIFTQGTPSEVPESFKRLVLHAGGQDASQIPTNWTLMRNQMMADLAQQTEAHATRSQPVLLFINGEPWGLYYLRERIDEFFLQDRLGVTSADQLDTPARRSEYLDATGPGYDHWDNLTDFIAANDLADPSNYAYVQTQVDIDNFIDYSVLQIYSANFDWPFTNISQFRPNTPGGRWQWVIWDSDLSLGLRPWSDVSMDTLGQALDPGYTAGTSLSSDGRDTMLLRALLENPDFRSKFLGRAAALFNDTLSADSVLSLIDKGASVIEAGIEFEGKRWQTAPAEWSANVEQIREFARARPDIVRRQIVDDLGLPGLAQLTVTAPAGGPGNVAIDGQLLPGLPWQGTLFTDNPTRLTAVPAAGYRFAAWDSPAGQSANPLNIPAGEQTITPRFELLNSEEPAPGDVTFNAYHVGAGDEADWIELRVNRPGGVDLRGWRVTDNDHKTADDEGSLIFADHPALADVPEGTILRIVVTSEKGIEDLNHNDRRLVLYSNNDSIDADSDPWFNLGKEDNLVLLAPGSTLSFDDDRGIAFLAIGQSRVTADSFGVLGDGVWDDDALR